MPVNILERKIFQTSNYAIAADFHPTQPWLLTGHTSGFVKIYNLNSNTVVHTFRLRSTSIYCVKFIARKNWYVVGPDINFYLHIFNCATHEKVIAFRPHMSDVRCVAVHPTAPILLTGSEDNTIKAWDWDNQWQNIQTYNGHTNWIRSISINPKDPNTFASASHDGTVKMWSIASPIPNFTIKAHDSYVQRVDFYPGADKPYFVTASSDNTIKVWDYLSQKCVQTITGHTDTVLFAVFHPSLPIIVSGCVDGAVKLWSSTSYELQHTLDYKFGWAWCIALRKDTSKVAVGFQRAVVTLELELRHSVPFQMAVSTGQMRGEASKKQIQKSSKGRRKERATSKMTNSEREIELARSLDSLTVISEAAPSLSAPSISYQQCSALAMELMTAKTTNKLISELRGDKAQYVADFLSKAGLKFPLNVVKALMRYSKMISDEVSFTQRERKYSLHLLSKLAKSAEVFPQSLELEGVQCNLLNFVAAGGYGFIYKGEHKGSTVCIKAVQVGPQGIDRRKMRVHASELTIWAHLKHRNVIPFLGIYASKEEVPRICIVSPWMVNGDLLQYLETVPDIPRKPLVQDIISGLQYLHGLDVIHADLKAKNVLVSRTGRALLADFGISRLSMTHTTMLTNASTGTAYWMAPELLLEQKPPSRESDIWSFACTCYEIVTGTMPFNQYYVAPLLIGAFMMNKIVPLKPEKLGIGWDEDVWLVAEQCWKAEPASRPKADEILDMINSFRYPDDRPSDPESYGKRNDAGVDYNRVFNTLDEIRQSATV